MRIFLAIWLFTVIAGVTILGFRGSRSTQPPIYVFPDMDIQARYNAQGANTFFADGRDMRPVVPGTVGRGQGFELLNVFSPDYRYALAENPPLYTGRDSDGEYFRGFPLEVTYDLMETGRHIYGIYCQVCHGKSGDGDGITKAYGMVATPTFHSDRLRDIPEGEIFATITDGRNLMGSYGASIQPRDRWAVIAYLRALQLAADAAVDDVPGEHRKDLGL